MKVDFNVDFGESFGRYRFGFDEEVMKYIILVNVVMGWYVGDFFVMRKMVKFVKENGVVVGVYLGYLDFFGFGRRYMKFIYDEVRNYIFY